ncbi:MAG: hypothetical protein ACRDT6_00695 [Micromonosporaceae bacterium]
MLTSTVDREAETITATFGAEAITFDVVTARAVWITINEAVYAERSLRADGPTLTLECDRGTGRVVSLRRDV